MMCKVPIGVNSLHAHTSLETMENTELREVALLAKVTQNISVTGGAERRVR